MRAEDFEEEDEGVYGRRRYADAVERGFEGSGLCEVEGGGDREEMFDHGVARSGTEWNTTNKLVWKVFVDDNGEEITVEDAIERKILTFWTYESWGLDLDTGTGELRDDGVVVGIVNMNVPSGVNLSDWGDY
ncbi:hypothetical protein TrLO_g5788 [Triparma laevis f. longispina]|uniref:Uncharacterized protein n=1 Tax=Triparma laevis f. longispina TaxID=1714387 RepID=A0A9W7FVG0_9STRA|nr:hypothetical protein TrLO_g5788 [Triparma laevis f. longispina]